MSDLYQGLPQSNLTYLTQSTQDSETLASILASYDVNGFKNFVNSKNTQNNAKADSAFTGVTVTSNYSKSVHDKFTKPTYSHANYMYRNLSLESSNDELLKLQAYLAQTNQEVPSALATMISEDEERKNSKNAHNNTIITEKNPFIQELSGVETLAWYYGSDDDGNLAWGRHGNWDNHSDYSDYSNHSDYYDSRYGDYYYDSNYYDSNYYDYADKYMNNPTGTVYSKEYNQYTTPVKTTVNYAPTKPEIYLQEVLSNMQNTVTVGYYSYDRNVKTGISTFNNTRYKVELRKLTGPNTRAWQTVQDGTSDKITLNPLDPFNIGWTKTTDSYGSYELRITPYNPAVTGNIDGWNYPSSQVNGTPLTVSFNIAVNKAPTVSTDSNSPVIGSVLYMDGAVKGSTQYDYTQFYGTGVPSTNRRGIYLAVTVREPDANQYIKASVQLKDRNNNVIQATVPVIWTNGTDKIQSNGSTALTGYAFISSDAIKDRKFDGQLEMIVDDYYDSGCTVKSSTTNVRQNIVGNGNTTLLNLSLDMQKTMNFDVAELIPSGSVTIKPTVNIKANQQNHLRDSFSKLEYSWSTSPTSPTTYTNNGGSTLSVQPPGDGIWYLHAKITDKYGKTLTNTTGPVYYSATSLVNSTPNLTHFDGSDRIKVTANVTQTPTIPLTYEYRYAYKPKGSPDSAYIFSDWQSSKQFTTGNIKIYAGVDVITEVKALEVNSVTRSTVRTLELPEKLAWCIRNQKESGYNIESTSLPINLIHGSNGLTSDGYKVLTNLPPELQSELRPNEYFYYKLTTESNYHFKKIIYFSDPVTKGGI